METGEYETNTLSINSVSSITYHLYEPSPHLSQNFASVALEIENSLRDRGYIVLYDAARRGLWHFLFLTKDEDEDENLDKAGDSLGLPLDVLEQGLVVKEEGVVEPPIMPKPRSQALQSGNTPAGLLSANPTLEQAHRPALSSPLQTTTPSSQDHDVKAEHTIKTTPQSLLYEKLITAVSLTISTTFCRRTGAIPLNYRTILISPNTYSAQPHGVAIGRPQILGTFRVYLTTAGALVIGISLTKCKGIVSLDDTAASSLAPAGYSVLAAPFGIMTATQNFVPGDGGLSSLAQTPMTHFFSFRNGLDGQESLWKQACQQFLDFRGIAASTLGGCLWVNLLVPKSKSADSKGDYRSSGANSSFTLPWPRRLCFRKKNVDASSTSRVVDTVLSGHEESHDPLGNAKGWHSSLTEREERVKRSAERAAAIPKDSHPQPAESKTPKPSGLSPVALQRPNTATAGIMYPTPPDGVQQPNGVTPSMDGTFSSPGNPLSAPINPEADLTMQNEPVGGIGLDQSPNVAETKRRRSDNLLGDTDNMLGGDVGGDIFEDNDITEADFNFFDEKPGDLDIEIAMGELPSSDMAPSQAAEEPTKPVQVMQQPLASTPVSLPPSAPSLPPSTPTPFPAVSPTSAPTSALPVAISLPPPPPPSLPSQKETAVFAKPELKHARSQNEDAVRRNRGDMRVIPAKRESSPFDPHAVFKRVKASLKRPKYDSSISTQPHWRKEKVFESLDFDPAIPMISKKYEQGGFFDLSALTKVERVEKANGDVPAVPETDYLKRHGKLNRKLRDRSAARHTISKQYFALEPQILTTTSPMKLDGSISDREDGNIESDQDDSSYTSDEPGSPHKASIRLMHGDDDIMSQITTLRDCDIEEPDHQLAMELPRLARSDISGVSLSQLFLDPEPLVLDMGLSDEDVIQVAQIVADQAATGSLDIFNASDFEPATLSSSEKRSDLSIHARDAFYTLEGIITHFFEDAMPVRLKGLLDIQDLPILSQFIPRQITGREGNSETMRPSNLYQIPGPHLEVQRADTKLSVLPSAVPFWESLGLSPCSGSKNVNAICVFPGWSGMGDNVKAFMDRVKSIYELLKLGTFEVMPLGEDVEAGLLPYEVDRITTSPDATVTRHGSAMVECMEALRGVFSNLAITETNFVIYFVYSPENPGTIIESCTAFQRFYELYQKILASRKEPPQNELVLQLVSTEVLSSPSALVITQTSDLVRLCIETYDRCTLFGGPMPAPAIRLEQLLPRLIDFKLTTTPSASLIRENSCVHVAYSQSVDERWVTAAWTDDRGNQQATAAYCMGRKGKAPSRNMTEIANEIWETTLALISSWRVVWRVIITKCGPMAQHEVDFWVDLARTEIQAKVTLVLLTVDSSPSLQLLPPAIKLPAPVAALHTPVSTPQPSMQSPEPVATPATPAANATAATPSNDGTGTAEAEADEILVDITDQTWGAIAGHRLSNSSSILEVQLSLMSGYLIKRTGLRLEDPPVVMEVNLIYTEAIPRLHEPLLREMLGYFRGLGTLARARGVVDKEGDVRPWHVAAAEKAVRALYLL
ncbi:mediator complex subunit 13 C-terminal domain-containing protein, partial [Trichoderma sp. TUCIM 5745]